MNSKDSKSISNLDRPVFAISLIVLAIFAIPLFIFPDWSEHQLSTLKKSIDANFGIAYQWLAITVLIISLWLAFSKYGKITLGKGIPAFNTYSWASMIFCAGVATGILYWGFIEWAFYKNTPPFEIAPHSTKAIEWASTYGMFHWGPAGWAFYVFPSLAIGYAYHNLDKTSMRLSVACSGVLGKHTNGFWGKLIDVLFIIGLLGSSGTSLGIGTPMIAAVVNDLFGIGTSFEVKLGIISLCSAIFATSVYLGLSKGIKRLSNFNTSMAFLFLGFILLVGPTVFILKMFTNSIGLMTTNFVRMLTWTDPINNTGFIEDWSIFYWSWWTAVGPFMGIFIAKISKGRSFKQIILGTIFIGAAGCSLFYGIFGNYALYQEISELVISTELVKNEEAPTAISHIIKTLPLGNLSLMFFAIMSVVFMATSFDSTSYVLATGTTSDIGKEEEPMRWLRLFWAFILVILPVGLMFIGGLEALKTTVLISALPLIFVYILMIFSLFKWIRKHEF